MSSPYFAQPPIPIKRGELTSHLRQLIVRLRFIVWQILVPFRSRPEEIPPLPEPAAEIEDKQVDQCQWLYDQTEKRRSHLEQKAQSTFGLMTFLVPLLVSQFVFVISKATGPSSTSRSVSMTLLAVATVLLLLGFVSAVRAVAVKAVEALYLQSVVDETGRFRKYEKAFRARGLLWCTAMNEAMNDHLAQFVKGAHVLTAGAIITVALAAVPTGMMFSSLPSSAAQMRIVGTVDVSSGELSDLRADLATLNKAVDAISKSKASRDEIKSLQKMVTALDAKLKKLPKTPAHEP
jgi:hypothetical protein